MPTIKQLNQIWHSQYLMFGAAGEPKENDDGNLVNETPLTPQNLFQNSKGEVIGEVVFDEKNDSIKIIPFKSAR